MAIDDAVEAHSKFSQPFTESQSQTIKQLREWALVAQHQADAKSNAICKWIEQHLKTDGEWNQERVILFTEYRTTQQWMQKILTEKGYGGERLSLIHGGMDQEDRELAKAAFQTSPRKRL